MSKRMGPAARARAAAREAAGPGNPQAPPSFHSLVAQGLECHDRAEKRRNDNPTAALQLYRGAIEAYQRAEQLIQGEEQSSAELSFNLGVAYSGIANVYK